MYDYLLLLLPLFLFSSSPVRPDAAVLVAARDDGYVDMASVKALQVKGGVLTGWGSGVLSAGSTACTLGRQVMDILPCSQVLNCLLL